MSFKSILVVEDDMDIRDLLCELLRQEGYSVMRACNGKEAFDVLHSADLPDLILLDLMMPVMDGRTFLHLKSNDPKLEELPVIVLTAAAEGLSNQVNGFIRKPFDSDKILSAVAQCIR